jgi:hypothetical protein
MLYVFHRIGFLVLGNTSFTRFRERAMSVATFPSAMFHPCSVVMGECNDQCNDAREEHDADRDRCVQVGSVHGHLQGEKAGRRNEAGPTEYELPKPRRQLGVLGQVSAISYGHFLSIVGSRS